MTRAELETLVARAERAERAERIMRAIRMIYHSHYECERREADAEFQAALDSVPKISAAPQSTENHPEQTTGVPVGNATGGAADPFYDQTRRKY